MHSFTMKMLDYICVLIFSLAFTSIASQDMSTEDYHQHQGIHYYKFHGELAPSWDLARKVCLLEGGYLAVVNSEEESRVLSAMFAAANVSAGASFNYVAYIGFHDMFTEGDYTTVFGEPLSSTGFTRWLPGEPSDDHSGVDYVEDCGGINIKDGGLQDLRCNSSVAFICERE